MKFAYDRGMHAPSAMIRASRSFWRDGRQVERTGYLISALLLISGVVHLGILLGSGGSWQGPLSWRKPAAFGVSFGLTLATVVWVSSFLRLQERTRSQLLGAFIAACAFETVLVSLQTWRGVPSHFNVETAFDATIARGLAAGGFVLVVIIVALTRVAFSVNPAIPISLRVAIQFGFVILCGAMAAGAVMIARGMMLVSAGDSAAAYATGGALKPTHAIAMHAILILPALAWLLSFVEWSESRRLTIVLWAAAGYAGLAAVIAAANLAGLQPERMPFAANVLSAFCVLILLGAGARTLAALGRGPWRDGIEHQ